MKVTKKDSDHSLKQKLESYDVAIKWIDSFINQKHCDYDHWMSVKNRLFKKIESLQGIKKP